MIPPSGVSPIIQRLVSGLERLGGSPGRLDYKRLADLKDELKIDYRSPECRHGGESPRDLEAGDISPSGGGI